MRTAVITAFLCLALPAGRAASASDTAIVAAGKLADKANYSWSTSISNEENRGQIQVEGQTVRGGYTLITTRNLPDILRNRGVVRDAENASQVWFRGGDRCVVLTDEGWALPDELPAAATSTARTPNRNATSGRAGRSGARAVPGSVPTRIEDYTFELRSPAEDLDLIIGSFTTMRAAGDSFTGELTDAGAALFLSFFGQPKVQVRRATGSFHCWTENGVVVRYEVQITGTVNLIGDRTALPVNWTITTEIHDIGTTRLNVPAAVRAKLG